jgi:hypothetical protein
MGKGKKGKYASAPKGTKGKKAVKEVEAVKTTDEIMAELAERKFTLRPTAEMYPDILCTFGTNEEKVHPNAKSIRVEDLSLLYHGKFQWICFSGMTRHLVETVRILFDECILFVLVRACSCLFVLVRHRIDPREFKSRIVDYCLHLIHRP